jgi:predicted ATP-grasp superfamily ATP-dependent carboligase
MKVLITSSRLPHALGEVRKFGEAGHEVYTTDTFRTSPGSHSRYVKQSFITASPRFETAKFIADLQEILRAHAIDLLVPCFEEVFYIAKHAAELTPLTAVFCPPFETLARVHNKATFTELTQQLGLPIAKTKTVTSQAELKAAAAEFPEYFARAAFSRGGVELFTNTGPLAGAVKLEDIQPTKDQPWLISEFIHGKDVCSFSIAQHGKLVAHCTYEHPMTIEHAGGIEFISVDEPQSVQIAQAYIEALNYHGQISFDYMKTDKGLYMVECNPRPTAGVFMMDPQEFATAIFTPLSAPIVVKPGVREQIAIAIIRDMFRNPRDIPSDLHELFTGGKDLYSEGGDVLPLLYSVLSYSHVFAFRRRMHVTKHKHSDLMEAQFFDIAWDGRAIA